MTLVNLPSIRRLLRPDPGCTFIDADLQRADAQFVAWEADESELKHVFQTGLDIYTSEALHVYGLPSNDNAKRDQRQRMKSVVHASNYGAKGRTLASTAGVTVHTMEQWLNKRWYGRFPGLPRWHKRVERQLRFDHQIRNIWGFRRFYFDTNDSVLPQALAWMCQSGVAIVINKAMLRIRSELPYIRIKLQVHDSLVNQVESHRASEAVPRIVEAMKIVVPYDDPLIIPTSVKMSDISWGDVG